MKSLANHQTQTTTAVGRGAENLAKLWLEKKGWRFIAQNVLGPGGEVDLIFEDPKAKQLVFVEVKARKSARFGSGVEAVTPHKLARLQRVANFFMQSHPDLPQSGRIDILSITNQEFTKPEFEHIENVF